MKQGEWPIRTDIDAMLAEQRTASRACRWRVQGASFAAGGDQFDGTWTALNLDVILDIPVTISM